MNRVPLTVLWVLLIVGASVRALDVWRPVDQPDWREADVAAIARNYQREDMALAYPRVDWRGDGPGFAEMEFPLYPWVIALAYRAVGQHEEIGRVIALLAALGSLWVFALLAKRLLAATAALVAIGFFAVSPLAIRLASALQPDGLMLLCYLLGAWWFLRWLEAGRWHDYSGALAATAGAILLKATAAHIGVFFLGALLLRRGATALRDLRVWLFGFVALLPAALWYWHAHGFWTHYGLSLGISNEYHWIGRDFFSNPRFALGIAGIEVLAVFTVSGAVLAAIGTVVRRHTMGIQYAVLWLAATWLFYLVTARTSSESWADYYHVFSVPPAALMVGTGAEVLVGWWRERRYARYYAVVVPLIVLVPLVFLIGLGDALPVGASPPYKLAYGAFFLSVVALGVGTWTGRATESRRGARPMYAATLLWVAGVMAVALYSRPFFYPGHPSELYQCALSFRSVIPPASLIVASGGRCVDDDGLPLAFNASYMFLWLDRRGWNLCVEDQGLEQLEALRTRGAQYFIAVERYLKARPAFVTALAERYPVAARCPAARVFKLNGASAATSRHGHP